jgi:hypothetical protein
MSRLGDILRVLVIALVVAQASGVPHLVAEAVEAGAAESDCNNDCAGDVPCSPLCPTCTCSHATRPGLVPVVVLEVPLPAPQLASPVEDATALPPDPAPRAIFHPPRRPLSPTRS